MQETAKVNYVHYGKGSKKGKSKPRPSGGSGSSSGGSAAESILGTQQNLLERVRKFHYPLTSVGDVEKAGIKKVNPVKLWKQCVETVEPRDIMRKVCMKKSTHLVNVPGTSTDSEPDYFNEHGRPCCMPTHTWFMLRKLIRINTSSNYPLVQTSRK